MIHNNIKELADYEKQSANAQQAQESKSLSEEEFQKIIHNMLIPDSIADVKYLEFIISSYKIHIRDAEKCALLSELSAILSINGEESIAKAI